MVIYYYRGIYLIVSGLDVIIRIHLLAQISIHGIACLKSKRDTMIHNIPITIIRFLSFNDITIPIIHFLYFIIVY